VTDCATIAATVRETLLRQWPGRFEPDQLGNETSLGAEGLGLDSIEIVELLLVCEESCGDFMADELLGGGPITIRRLVDHFARA
jgi:acyl carrier protein